MSKYSIISVPRELHDELQKKVNRKPELGYSSIAEFCKEAIRIHVSNVRMERREALLQQIDFGELLKKIELAASTNGGEYRQIFENLKAPAFIISPDGRIINCNDETVDSLGYSRKEELLDENISTIFSDEREMNEMMEYINSRSFVKNYEIKLLRRDGKALDFILAVGTIKKRGKVEKYIGIGKDITARKMVEARLKKERELYSLILTEMCDAITVLQDGKIKFAGGQCRATGYSTEELTGINFLDIVAPEDKKRVEENYRKRIEGKDVPSIVRYKLISKDGKIREIEASMRIIEYEGRPADLAVIRYHA
ncbi:MAG: PAS domain S-box protein [Candidatus Thermoplasmatota archaeon]|nr:PAS domain S-box protein [Candidatus Thermoplasmatota archaeon]